MCVLVLAVKYSMYWKQLVDLSYQLTEGAVNGTILQQEPSEIYIFLLFLYKFETLEAYISLNIDIFYIFFVWEFFI